METNETEVASCLFCCHNIEVNRYCNAVSRQFRDHKFVGINKLGRDANLPCGDEHKVWRSVILSRLDSRTQCKVKPNMRYRIAAHHFLPQCIIDNNATKFLRKVIPNIAGKYTIYSCNFISDKKDYPHGAKASKLWYSIPDQTNSEASQTYATMVAEYEIRMEIERQNKQKEHEEMFQS